MKRWIFFQTKSKLSNGRFSFGSGALLGSSGGCESDLMMPPPPSGQGRGALTTKEEEEEEEEEFRRRRRMVARRGVATTEEESDYAYIDRSTHSITGYLNQRFFAVILLFVHIY